MEPNEPVPPVIVITEPEIFFFDKKYLYLCSVSSFMLAPIGVFVQGRHSIVLNNEVKSDYLWLSGTSISESIFEFCDDLET